MKSLEQCFKGYFVPLKIPSKNKNKFAILNLSGIESSKGHTSEQLKRSLRSPTQFQEQGNCTSVALGKAQWRKCHLPWQQTGTGLRSLQEFHTRFPFFSTHSFVLFTVTLLSRDIYCQYQTQPLLIWNYTNRTSGLAEWRADIVFFLP